MFLTHMMPQTIYTSHLPPVPIVEQSIFTFLFSSSDPAFVGAFPASQPAFVDADTGTTLTRGQLRILALQFAFGVRYTLSAKRGDVILVYSQNSVAWPVVVLGSVAAGLICTLANISYTSRELAFQYTDSGAKLIFTSEKGLPTVRQTFHELGFSKEEGDRHIVVLPQSLQWAGGPDAPRRSEASGLLELRDLLGKGTLQTEERFDGKDAHETVYLCYSSGTTGKPKGVETTHRNLTSVLPMIKPVFPLIDTSDRLLAILPFFHIYGAVKLMLFPFICGTVVVVMSHFDPIQFFSNIEKYQITIALVVPPVLVLMAKHPAVDKYDFSTLRVLSSGAAPLGEFLIKAVKDRLETKRTNGLPLCITQGYGLTETSPSSHILPASSAHKYGSVGLVLPNLEVRLVVDEEGRVDAEEGQPGGLWLRGPTVMKGYLNRPDATKEAITPDKWFKTGDVAIRDKEGFFFIVDRLKELIKYKGFQVPPAELESVLLTHPDIADVAVIGVQSEKEATELPRAYIVHARPEELRNEAQKIAFSQHVRSWIQGKVASYKFLRGGVVVIDAVPKSSSGKILRRQLRGIAEQELAGRDPTDVEIRPKL